MNQPPSSSRDPRPPPDPNEDPAKEVAKGAALGCLAGFGALGAAVAMTMLVLGAVAIVGVLLIFLACSGH